MKDELIGKTVEIVNDKKSFKGTVIDETKNMLCLLVSRKKRWLIKKTSIIMQNNKIIDGKKITKRPEDRIKSC